MVLYFKKVLRREVSISIKIQEVSFKEVLYFNWYGFIVAIVVFDKAGTKYCPTCIHFAEVWNTIWILSVSVVGTLIYQAIPLSFFIDKNIKVKVTMTSPKLYFDISDKLKTDRQPSSAMISKVAVTMSEWPPSKDPGFSSPVRNAEQQGATYQGYAPPKPQPTAVDIVPNYSPPKGNTWRHSFAHDVLLCIIF